MSDVTPRQYLEQSEHCRQDAQWATAHAMRGILKLLIDVYMPPEPEDEEPLEGEVDEDRLNPMGECDSGHEFFTNGCPACAEDSAQYQADTVEVSDRDDR